MGRRVKKEFNKLVRDNIPDILSKDETVATYGISHVTDAGLIRQFVADKLQEELKEVLSAAKKDLPVELADLLEVMQKFAQINGIFWDDVLVAQQVKAAKIGKFDRNIILKEITYK